MALDDFRLVRFDFGDAGQHDDRHVVETLVEPHLFEHFEPRAIVGEPQVENHGVDVGGFQSHQGGIGVAGLQHVAARAREKLLENAPRRQRILDDEHCAPRPGLNKSSHGSFGSCAGGAPLPRAAGRPDRAVTTSIPEAPDGQALRFRAVSGLHSPAMHVSCPVVEQDCCTVVSRALPLNHEKNWCWVLVAAAAIHIHAQQDQTPIFRAGTTLVEFTHRRDGPKR